MKKKVRKRISINLLLVYYMAFLKPVFGERRVNDITFAEWTAFKNHLSASEDTWTNEMTVSESECALKGFHEVFSYGKKHFGLSDPTTKWWSVEPLSLKEAQKAEKIKAVKKLDQYTFSSRVTELFNEVEVEKMKAHTIWYNNTHICVMLCLYAGLSLSELGGLRWEDIDAENRFVKVRRVYYRRYDPKNKAVTQMMETEPPKVNGIRDIPIPDWLADRLMKLKRVYDGMDYICSGNRSIVYPATFGSRYYPKYLEWSGVEKHPFSALRNTFVRYCFENGMSIWKISQLIGDSDKKITIKNYFEIKDG